MTIFRRFFYAGATIAALAMTTGPAMATNGQLPTCIGTYKCGMGGAGIGLATDATAAAVNPGLIARMGNEFIISVGWFHADVTGDAHGAQGNGLGPQESDASDFANGSLGVNYRLNDKWAVNLSLYPGGGGASDWDISRTEGKNGQASGVDHAIRWRMFAGQLGVGWAPTKKASYGLGLVVIRSDMKTDSLDNAFNLPTPGPNQVVDVAWGAGVQVGGVWDLMDDQLTFAFDYQSEVFMQRFQKYKNIFNSPVNRPPTTTLGAIIRPTSATRLAFDLKHIEQTAVRTISSEPAAEGGFGWKNRFVYMAGAEHDWDDKLTVRAGWNYGESPIDEGHVFANFLFPGITEHHFTAGGSYEFLPGMEVGFSGYYAPRVIITDDGSGDSFSQNNSGSWLKHRQYGMQLSFRKSF
ncbi:MAG: hypothetical protein HOH04_03430 [Rhodospirillaceae bacterium]|jgi:long-chain fatty acid transport protein|nr:hypothetical protein [Rhodospirillaceae bacterium]